MEQIIHAWNINSIPCYALGMKLTRSTLMASGKSLLAWVRDFLCGVAGNDPERSIAEFKSLSGHGDSRGSHFNRNGIHERAKVS
jgi:hypothetical protein